MNGYNASARAMIRYANRACSECTYGDWSKTWKKTTTARRGPMTSSHTVVYFRRRKCSKCGLYDTQTEYRNYWRNNGSNDWIPCSEYDKTIPFQEVNK